MRDLVRSEAGESERLRTLSPVIVDAMWDCGLMPAFNPKAAGGVEPSFREMIDTWIEMAWQDGSFGLDRNRQPALDVRGRHVSP
jgi:hypothetical protein